MDGSFGINAKQESDGFSVAYTLGGMTISYVDNNHDNSLMVQQVRTTDKSYSVLHSN